QQKGLWMISQRVLAAMSLPAIFGVIVLGALAAAIVLFVLYRWWRRRQTTAPPAAPLLPPAAQAGAVYPVDSTQPNRPATLPPGMYLVDATGQQFALDRLPAVIGRSPQSNVVVNTPTVSYQHARIAT